MRIRIVANAMCTRFPNLGVRVTGVNGSVSDDDPCIFDRVRRFILLLGDNQKFNGNMLVPLTTCTVLVQVACSKAKWESIPFSTKMQ